MKLLDRIMLRRYTSAAVILLAVLAWPSAGWSRTTGRACNVNHVVKVLLRNWADTLQRSWKDDNPNLIVDKYQANAVLLPTCANGPMIGRAQIKGYFENFLKDKPVVTEIGEPTVGGNCNAPFGSGLYTFKLDGGAGTQLRARYTYIFHQTGPASWLVTQHHSSLEPVPASSCAPH
jgi:hypothetical protein